MAISSPSAFPAYIFSHQTAGGKEADGWCDGTDNSVSFCAAMKEEGDTNSNSQFTSSAVTHCLIKATDGL